MSSLSAIFVLRGSDDAHNAAAWRFCDLAFSGYATSGRLEDHRAKEQSMRLMILSLAAAFALGTTAASACSWNKAKVAQTDVDMKKVMQEHEVAQAPVDAWLIEYLDAWEKA
jgi:hypothetical protein